MVNLKQSWQSSQEPRVWVPTAISAVVGILASVTAQAAPWGPVDVNQTPQEWLDNCLIYATEGVDVPGPFEIFGDPQALGFFPYRSDVCSLGTATIGGNTQKATVPVEATKQVDVAVVSPTINLKRGSATSECAYSSGAGGSLTIDPDISINPCPVQRNVNLSGMPATIQSVLPFPSITPGATDIVVPTGETYTLPGPGQYGRVLLFPSSVLVFPTAGDYDFLSIETRTDETRADIVVNAMGVNIKAKEYIFLGHRSRVNEAGTRLLKVFVAGGNGWVIDGQPRLAFTHRGDGYFNACYVYSPNGWQSWRGKPLNNGSFKTQSFGMGFFEDTTTAAFRVTMEHPQDPQCLDPAPPPPAVDCDFKTLTPATINTANATVKAAVQISNTTQTAANAAIAEDTMGSQMTYAGNGLFDGSPIAPTGGPPTYKFALPAIPAGATRSLTYDINIQGLGVGERACNSVTVENADQAGSQCGACVTRRDEPPPPAKAVCDYKRLTPDTLYTSSGTLDVEVQIANDGQIAADEVVITDSMNPKMVYVPGSARANGEPIADPTGGPPTYTFAPRAIGAGDTLALTYQVQVSGLNPGETIANNVQVTTDSSIKLKTQSVSKQANGDDTQCSATVTRRTPPPPPTPIPTLGTIGLVTLASVLAALGAFVRRRQRRS